MPKLPSGTQYGYDPAPLLRIIDNVQTGDIAPELMEIEQPNDLLPFVDVVLFRPSAQPLAYPAEPELDGMEPYSSGYTLGTIGEWIQTWSEEDRDAFQAFVNQSAADGYFDELFSRVRTAQTQARAKLNFRDAVKADAEHGSPLDLIELSDWPTMPAPLQSTTPGEAWIWGDYVLTVQTKPMNMMDALAAQAGKTPPEPRIEYPYVMSVFYKKTKNPHGPSERPILAIAVEKPNYDPTALVQIGIFAAAKRMNLGDFLEEITMDSARSKFFEVVRSRLRLVGEPRRIGVIADIHGHPETGWEKRRKSGKLGWIVLVLLAALAFLAYWFLR